MESELQLNSTTVSGGCQPDWEHLEQLQRINNPLLTDTLALFDKWLAIRDWEAVRIILGAATALYIPGKPIWLRIIKASGAGGTTLLMPLLANEDSKLLGSLTEASTEGKMDGGAMLLSEFDGKRAITLDLSKIISKRSYVRTAVFGGLRDVYDGTTATLTNTKDGYRPYSGKFDWLLATTGAAIEGQRNLDAELGQRFLDLRLQVDADEAVEQATKIASANMLEQRDRELSAACNELLKDAKQRAEQQGYPKIPDSIPQGIRAKLSMQQRIVELGKILPRLRSTVKRDYQHNVISKPEIEVGTRVVECFCRLAQGIALIAGHDEVSTYEYFHLIRVALDSVSSVRRQVLAQILSGNTTEASIQEALGYNPYYPLEDLRLLGITSRGNNLAIGLDVDLTGIPDYLKLTLVSDS